MSGIAIWAISSNVAVKNNGVDQPKVRKSEPRTVEITNGSFLKALKEISPPDTNQIPNEKDKIAVIAKIITAYPRPTSPKEKYAMGNPIFPVFPKVKGARNVLLFILRNFIESQKIIIKMKYVTNVALLINTKS